MSAPQRLLIEHGLLDELRLLVSPVLLAAAPVPTHRTASVNPGLQAVTGGCGE